MGQTKIDLRFSKLSKALDGLEQAERLPMTTDHLARDTTIHRFKFGVDLSLRLLKTILESLGTHVHSPKPVLQEAFANHLIDDKQVWLDMLKDRNLTSHTYDQQIADEIFSNIRTYIPLLRKTFNKLTKEFA